MGERQHHPPGTHSWVDLSTTDAEGAKAFYGALLGWDRIEDMPAGEGMTYSMAFVRDRSVAALFEGDGSLPPHWNCYVTVESADAAGELVESAGGEVVMPPFDVLHVGRMLVLKDPTGAVLSLWEPRGHIGAERVNEPGCLTWNDLNTPDPEAAQAFYGSLFGWTFEAMPGHPYWVIRNGERSNGGVRALTDAEQQGGVPAHWLAYFAVGDAEAAAQRAAGLGAHVVMPVMTVPNGGRFAVLQDPQGALFGVFSGDLDD